MSQTILHKTRIEAYQRIKNPNANTMVVGSPALTWCLLMGLKETLNFKNT